MRDSIGEKMSNILFDDNWIKCEICGLKQSKEWIRIDWNGLGLLSYERLCSEKCFNKYKQKINRNNKKVEK